LNETYQAFKQLPQQQVELQKNVIMSAISQEKYNNWKQITIQNKDKIDNELDKQQRKENIMSQ